MKLTYKSNFDKLIQKLEHDKAEIPMKGKQWVIESTYRLYQVMRSHLGEQGRGGAGPRLSDVTTRLYESIGKSEGSGLTNHIAVDFQFREHSATGIVGIPAGRPTTIAKVQNNGALISVSEKMRGFLAVHGIYLKAETTHVYVPGRHFWSRSIQRSSKIARRRARRIQR